MPSAAEKKTVSRILVMKIRLPASEAMKPLSMLIKSTKPFIAGMGDPPMRLLRNVDNPTEIIQIVEYEAERAFELNRQRIASDPLVRNFMQAWRTLFPLGIELDVYEDVTEGATENV